MSIGREANHAVHLCAREALSLHFSSSFDGIPVFSRGTVQNRISDSDSIKL